MFHFNMSNKNIVIFLHIPLLMPKTIFMSKSKLISASTFSKVLFIYLFFEQMCIYLVCALVHLLYEAVSFG